MWLLNQRSRVHDLQPGERRCGNGGADFDLTPRATGNPATSNAITMVVNNNLPVSVTIASDASNNTICAGTSVTFTATR